VAPAFLALIRGKYSRRAALAAILALAAALRLHRLPEQGLLLFDEGFLVIEARSVQTLARTLMGGRGSRELLAPAVMHSPVLFAKPAHNLALAASLSLEPRTERATLALSATAGILCVWATFLLGQSLFGWGAGMLAALVLAVSPYHLLYSRSGLSDSLTILFWILALWVWVRGGKYSALVSGIAGGICAATNYRELFLPAVFLALAFRGYGAGNFRAVAVKFAGWLGGFLAVLLAFESAYRITSAVAGAPFPNGTYAAQLWTLLSVHGSQGFRFTGWPAFFRYIYEWEGLISLAWLAAAAAFQFRRWRGGDGILNLSLLLPWLLFSAYWDNASRFFAVILPLVAIMKGRWMLEGWRLIRDRTGAAVATALGMALLLSIVPHVRPMVPRPSPYTAAAKLLADSGSPRHYSSNPWIGDALLGISSASPFPAGPGKIRRDIRFAVTDLQVLFGGFYQPEERYRTAAWIAGHYTAVLEEPYGSMALSQYIFEQDMDFQGALRMMKELKKGAVSLKVFDLSRPVRRN
jgi:hypothetical protein